MSHLVVNNCTLFDATSEEAISPACLWTEDDTIRYAGPQDGAPQTPPDAEIIDGMGKFVMPGMTETHAHLSFSDASPFGIGDIPVETSTIIAVGNAAKMLRAGFTSAISFGSTYHIDVALRAAINSGAIIGPRLLAAGQDLGVTASNVDSQGSLSQIADGPWALRKAVREQRRLQVDVVKIFVDGEAINTTCPPGELSFHDEEINAIVEEAHRRRMRVASHSRSAAAVKQAVRAGVDFIGHGNYLDDEAVEVLAEHRDRVVVGPGIAWEVGYLEHCETLGISKETVRAQGYEAEIEATIVSVQKMREAGIRMVIGGDYGISVCPHGTYAKDIEHFVTYFGMRNGEALLCATRNGGQAFDPEGKHGTLEASHRADFLIVDGNPLEDVRVLQDQERIAVYKGAQRVDGT